MSYQFYASDISARFFDFLRTAIFQPKKGNSAHHNVSHLEGVDLDKGSVAF